MKKVILGLLCLMLAPIFMSAQEETEKKEIVPYDAVKKKIIYQDVVEIKGSKDVLFNRSINWLNNYYKNPVSVTSLRDKATGKLKGKHQFRLYDEDDDGSKTGAGMVLYEFTIEFKEGRYRYTIEDFNLKQAIKFPIERWLNPTDPKRPEKAEVYLKQIDTYVQGLLDSLAFHMKPEKQAVEEEW